MFYLAARYLREIGWTEWDIIQIKRGIWLIFPPQQDSPAIVGKFSSLPQRRVAARSECAALRALASCAEELSIPRLLFERETTQGFLHLQSALPGRPLRDELVPSSDDARIASQLEIAESWLEKFRLAPSRGDLGTALREIQLLAAGKLPQVLLDAAAEDLPLLSATPAVAVHGDFWGHNVLVDRGRISVVDWDAFHYGAPLEDFFTFALGTVYRQLQDMERSVELIRTVFLGSSPLSTRIWAGAARILSRGGLSQDLLRPMFLMYLINRTVHVRFADAAALYAFACHYVDMGMPALGRIY
jgi:hypothetical protein